MKKYSQGITAQALVAIIALVIIVGGVVYFNSKPAPSVENPVSDEIHQAVSDEVQVPESEGDSTVSGDAQANEDDMEEELSFAGVVIAGRSSPLLEFNRGDYEKALTSEKLVMLYFYANWCPLCIVEFQKTKKAFDTLSGDDVVGFRVHFKDNDTTDDHEALAREYNVIIQHTKVFIKDGEQILKAPDTWDTDRYLSEFTKALN